MLEHICVNENLCKRIVPGSFVAVGIIGSADFFYLVRREKPCRGEQFPGQGRPLMGMISRIPRTFTLQSAKPRYLSGFAGRLLHFNLKSNLKTPH
ncbi:hypothetical protein D1841_16400 [Neglecta sp. X4]|uniref:hypothetical protein n=1 Tax=unclassified Neglectibacter TaxID=2632164 RepID=UPI00136FEA7C|nr:MULTISPECIES: hypothetical protein [unclassified Neglectibacter]NBI19045.1 hypothetical protein [Neglectibacter sp. 59]NBJ74749.1 hypothetical protein [Neglectibacter sp. X4]NCE82495.1 hypothetical protein [Neglectibacter sp. X58]